MTTSGFAQAFEGLRKQNVDLSPAMVVQPVFTRVPNAASKTQLSLEGYFPTKPLQIDFSVIYQAVDGYWRIDALSVTVKEPQSQEGRLP